MGVPRQTASAFQKSLGGLLERLQEANQLNASPPVQTKVHYTYPFFLRSNGRVCSKFEHRFAPIRAKSEVLLVVIKRTVITAAQKMKRENRDYKYISTVAHLSAPAI